MLQNGRGLNQRVVRRDPSVGPNLQNEPVVIGPLAHAGIFHGVTNPGDGRKERINRDDADGLVGLFVFIAGAETAADLDLQLHLELLLLVQRADVLAGVDQFHVLVEFDVPGGHGALFVD